MKIKTWMMVGILILMMIAVFIGFSSLSVIDDKPVALFEQASCDVPSDCNDFFTGLGMPIEEMDIVCVNNVCGSRG